MGNQLLIRAYNVGCGDCIYVRIPDANDGFHILIDCGKKGGDALLKKAIDHLKTELPKGSAAGTKRLDLIVATHRHEDHIKGFDPAWFANVEVKNIWLSAGMDPEHKQAEGVNKLRSFAAGQIKRLVEDGRSAMHPAVEMLASLYGVKNEVADDLLMVKLPKANGIKAAYMHTGMKHGVKLPADTEIHILAPEQDIDHFYLGKEVDQRLKGLLSLSGQLGGGAATTARPANISASDFQKLQSRMLSNGLAFAAKETSIQNNLSVVLLIVWKKKRLLFVGDAEWDREFKEGKNNGSWNVMWEKHRKTHLKGPVDFLKVGHHGSTNATPHPPELREPGSKPPAPGGVYTILDTILPVPKNGKKPTAQALVSTEREDYAPIPESKLLVNLASRVRNTCNYGEGLRKAGIDPQSIWVSNRAKNGNYFETREKEFLDLPQPIRTDLEFVLNQKDFVDVLIDA
jgi:beta-lactamase superfamily II metal-dependent hydrolase